MSVVLDPPVVEEPEEKELEAEEILRKAYEYLSDENNWCSGAAARDSNGHHVQPWDDDAVQRCAIGALVWAAGCENWVNPPALQEAYGRLAPSKSDGNPMFRVMRLNDAFGHHAVVQAFRRALSIPYGALGER